MRGRFSTIGIPSPSHPATNYLTQDSTTQGKRNEFPAVSRLDSEVYDERDTDMNIKIPGEAELLNSLAKVTKRDIYYYCERNQTEKQQIFIHLNILCFHKHQSQSAST
jgi:hypothetical protein